MNTPQIYQLDNFAQASPQAIADVSPDVAPEHRARPKYKKGKKPDLALLAILEATASTVPSEPKKTLRLRLALAVSEAAPDYSAAMIVTCLNKYAKTLPAEEADAAASAVALAKAIHQSVTYAKMARFTAMFRSALNVIEAEAKAPTSETGSVG